MSARDLAEAHAFVRRRLVAAFLSGAPDGREIEPARPGRTVLAGAAVAVLLVGGARFASVIAPRPPVGWDSPGVVVSKDTGARYLVVSAGGPLRPLADLTSAQLVLGMDYPVRVVPQRALAGHTVGAAVGVAGAPPQLPSRASLVDSGWTACTADDAGIAVDVSAAPPVGPLTGQGLLVRSRGEDYLVAEGADGRAHSFPVGLGAQALFAPSGTIRAPLNVPRGWLALLGEPSSLRFPAGVRAIRTRAGYDLVRTTPGASAAMAVGPFAAYLVAGGRPPAGRLPAGTRPDDHLLDGTSHVSWPYRLVQPAAGGPVCARLAAQAGPAPAAVLVAPDGADAWPVPAPRPRAAPVVRVDPGGGAFVRSAATARSTPFVIAATGRRYVLSDPATLDALGLEASAAVTIGPHWLALFRPGPALSRDAVLRSRSG